ncbi:tumor necrosis factor receptor superfamily member 14-like isoform X3 [Triplophysa dalaica]|uniref:tumor necrosis factor receptor superfamily member 14-like isoform X3 n=1 Tax=Triplophysa dalaica TaxID=1582913 RepID=UPI0024DFEACC|nr:tumor necrosis factor receptor superfamily member 14-like isoform X3 [Triplophysa dalaica]
MYTLRIIIIITSFIVPLNYEFCFCGCSRAEYEIFNQCCPMCAAGNHVLWHCADDSSTTCVPCPEFTFIDASNGFTNCFPCAVCDIGVKVNKVCTRSSNTLCGPLEGFYCIDTNKGSCTLAVKHSTCSPGKYIKQAGTASTDTVCGDCIGETYSNGSFSSCLAHTKCEALGLIETHQGTHSSDAECGNSSAVTAIITSSIIGTLILFLSLIVFARFCKKNKSSSGSGNQFNR